MAQYPSDQRRESPGTRAAYDRARVLFRKVCMGISSSCSYLIWCGGGLRYSKFLRYTDSIRVGRMITARGTAPPPGTSVIQLSASTASLFIHMKYVMHESTLNKVSDVQGLPRSCRSMLYKSLGVRSELSRDIHIMGKLFTAPHRHEMPKSRPFGPDF